MSLKIGLECKYRARGEPSTKSPRGGRVEEEWAPLVLRSPRRVIPVGGARDPFVARTFSFGFVLWAKTAQNLTIYFENLN